jgi:hypothetical protein
MTKKITEKKGKLIASAISPIREIKDKKIERSLGIPAKAIVGGPTKYAIEKKYKYKKRGK